MMKRSALFLASALSALTLSALTLAGPAQAQPKPAAAPAADAQPGATTATYQDWLMRCVSAEKTRTCEIVQNLQVQGQGVVASIAVGKVEAAGPLRLVVQVPAGVWLPAGLKFQVSEKAKPLALEYKRCLQGCFAELELDAATLQALKGAGEPGSFTFEDGARKSVTLPVSFKGFTPALDASLKP